MYSFLVSFKSPDSKLHYDILNKQLDNGFKIPGKYFLIRG